MGKGKIKLKKIFIISLLIIFLFQATYVFALEIKYPSVPGAFTPQEIEQKLKAGEIEKEDVLPLYFKYYFNLSLIIVVLICLGVIIYGGVLYLLSPAKPVILVSARRWIFSGLLGLLILFSSYLVLVTINPQLSLLKLGREEAKLLPPRVTPLAREATIYFEVPTGKLIEENLSHITATTTRVISGITHWPDYKDGKSDCWGGDKLPRDTIKYCTSDDFSFDEADCHWEDYPDSCENNEVMVAINWPECKNDGKMACWGGDAKIKCCGPVKLTGCYTTNTPSCKEGEVLHRITHWPDCQGWRTSYWDTQRDSAECCTLKNVKFTACYELQSPIVKGETINKFVSELEKVKSRSENLKDKLGQLKEATDACRCGTSNCVTDIRLHWGWTECLCKPDEPQCNIDCDKDAIIAAASSTKEAIGQLEAEKVRLVTLQIPIIIDYLEMKKAGLLMTLPEDEIDYGEFAFQRFLLEKEERKVETETFEGWPTPLLTREIEGERVSIIDPATFYFDPDLWENQQALAETQRLNPILILSNTSPKEFNEQIASTVEAVLGEDAFNLLSESDWEEIVRKSLEEGTFEALEDFTVALSEAVTKLLIEKLPQNILEKAKTSMLLEKKLALISVARAKEPDPLTEKLTEYFTTKLEDRLPPLLRDALEGDILDFVDQITGGDIKKIFTSKFYDFLSQNLQDLLSTKIADLSPELSRLLAIRVVEVLPFTIVADLLTSINDFLTEKINEIKELIWEQVDIIVQKVVEVITNVLLENLPEWLEPIILALMEGIELVVAEIAKGYVEMYIMYEFDSFLKDVYKFQDKLNDLLSLTIKDILPKEIKKFLKKTVMDLVPEDVQDFLDDSFLERLPEETRKFLTKSLKKFLPKEIRDILDESLASLLGIEFVFEKTLYDYFPKDLKDFFEKSAFVLFPETLRTSLIDFLPEEVRKPFIELSQEQRQKLFYTSILDLLEDCPLKKTPLEILGIEDDKMMDILGGDVRILVEIIEMYLKPEERPEFVNELIRILKKSLTDFIAEDLHNPELARDLNTPLYKNFPQEIQDNLNKSFADHFSELFDLLFDPSTDTLIDIIDKHSGSNISQILSQGILDLLPPEVINQLKIRLKDYLPSWITDKKLFEFLPDSWLGSIADFLGLTDEDIEEAIEETIDEIDLDEEVNQIIQALGERMTITASLIRNLGEKTGQRISEEKADELTEKISEYMSTLVEKSWGKVMSEGFMLDSLKNL